MIRLNRILFPTDGSECAEHARHHAFSLAERFDATVHVIRVEKGDAGSPDGIDIHASETEDLFCRREVICPSVVDGILSYAEKQGMDLTVLGTHGRRGVRRAVLGSVAEEVVRRAPCPVVTVGSGAKPPEAMEEGRLLVPVDFSDHQAQLLAHAREMARAYGMQVTLLHVVEVDGQPARDARSDADMLADRIWGGLTRRADELRADGVDASVEVRNGPVAPEVLAVAEDVDADLLAVATHGRTGLDRMLVGSVAEEVLRRAPCPVCTVKAFGRSLIPDEQEGDRSVPRGGSGEDTS